MDKYDKSFQRMLDDGVPKMDAFLAVMAQAEADGAVFHIEASGTRAEFESFVRGMDAHKREIVREHWQFTD